MLLKSVSYNSCNRIMKLKKFSCLLPDETQKLLKELANRKPLQLPSIYHHLPHLLKNEGSLHPAVQVGLGRTGGETHF